MNSHQKRKVKRAHLKVQRKAEMKLEAEQFRATAETPESERFKSGITLPELFEYMKSVHLKH